ncbi:Protein curvature thylakoid 1A, chloroplastic [Vitis vinifera]|uniref:Protein curvature thylakoid 1A, chloroplastic n=1 Tax=Vitis vinifera TaxID=29760 RepID=A0A438JMB5_VITVI|nr:Protein curvature thylakoid 1A, chloroplastic [Vitis vinifera]
MAMPYVAVASSSMAATPVLMPRLPATAAANAATRCSALPYLPPRLSSSSNHFSGSLHRFGPWTGLVMWTCVMKLGGLKWMVMGVMVSMCKMFSSLQVRASSSEETSLNTEELFTDLKAKWDALENKSTVFLYGGGAIVAVWLSSVVVGAVNSVPLLPKIMELVGLGYTAWFVYRYILFKSNRKELATDIEALKKKVTGAE